MPLQEKSWKEFQPAAQWKIISLQTPASQQVFLLPLEIRGLEVLILQGAPLDKTVPFICTS